VDDVKDEIFDMVKSKTWLGRIRVFGWGFHRNIIDTNVYIIYIIYIYIIHIYIHKIDIYIYIYILCTDVVFSIAVFNKWHVEKT